MTGAHLRQVLQAEIVLTQPYSQAGRSAVMETGGSTMKRLLVRTLLLAVVIGVPVLVMAAVDIRTGISLPPPIVFPAPPAVIVMPDTDEV